MTDDEGRAHYNSNREEYGLPARVDLRLISLRKGDTSASVARRIAEVHDQLQRAQSRPPVNSSFHQVFQDLAGQVSQDSFRAGAVMRVR